MTSHRLLGICAPTIFLACLLAGCQGSRTGTAPSEFENAWRHRVDKPNIVLIVVDTLRRDRLGCYGHDRATSPNIDRLADSATVFENAYSQAPWTLPSMAALLTSRYPSELGIKGFNQRIPDSEVFLQEVLSAHGYATHAVVSHDFVGAKWGFDQGFDSFQSFAGGHRTVSSEQVTQAALPILEELEKTPTFLLAHYFDPHFLYLEHGELPVQQQPPDADSRWWEMAFKRLRAQARRGLLTDQQRDYLLALYDSEIAFTDRQIGRLLERLDTTQRRADTIVILTADHGEEFLDHGGLGHTSTVFNELINVPLVIRWPGVDEPLRSDRAVALIDVFPTLLDYVGIDLERPVTGLPMHERAPDAPIFSETRRYQKSMAVIRNGIKLVHDESRDRTLFFDLETDPLELHGLSTVPSAGELLQAMSEHRQQAARALAGNEPGDEVQISPEERKKLEALGYVD